MSKNTGMQFKVKGKRAESLGALSNWLRDFEHDPLGVPRGIFYGVSSFGHSVGNGTKHSRNIWAE